MSTRGRKKIGERQIFNCPANLYDYVIKYGEDEGIFEFSAALRHLIADHRKLTRKSVISKSSSDAIN